MFACEHFCRCKSRPHYNPTGSGLVGSEFNKPWNWPVYSGSGREVGDDGSPY